MPFSVVLDRIPKDRAELGDYLEELASHHQISEVVIAIDPTTAPPEAREVLSLLDGNSKLRTSGFHNCENNAKFLNLTIASVAEDDVLYLSAPYDLTRLNLTLLKTALDRSSRKIFQLDCRLSSWPVTDSETIESYSLLRERTDSIAPVAIAFRKSFFLELRGFDERKDYASIYALDLLHRNRRLGFDDWNGLNDLGIAIRNDEQVVYPTFKPCDEETEQRNLILLSADDSIFKNIHSWSVPRNQRIPLISVAIATKDRPYLLIESIRSVLYQTFQDFEIVVVDDGSEDPALVQELIRSLGDTRIRYYRNEVSRGVAAARNQAADLTDCLLTAVHDDDDIMLPWRLETGISPLSDEIHATYGAWVNFDDKTADMRIFLTKEGFSPSLISFSGQTPGHSTWMLYTDIIRNLRYDETMTSAVDHNLAVRTLRAGINWLHTHEVLYLRRVHDIQITAQDGSRQKSGAGITRLGNRFMLTEDQLNSSMDTGAKLLYPLLKERDDLFRHFGSYLPDHLVTRTITIQNRVTDTLMQLSSADRAISILEDRDMISGKALAETGIVEDIKQSDFVGLREANLTNWTVSSRLRGPNELSPMEAADPEARESGAISNAEDIARTAVFERLDLVLKQLRRTHPAGSLLLKVFDNVPELSSVEPNAEIVFQRRIFAAAEFGVNYSCIAFAFGNVDEALAFGEEISAHENDCHLAIFPPVNA